ncbi:hypothetical protein ACAD32_00488 [Clavibacter nebraskensis]
MAGAAAVMFSRVMPSGKRTSSDTEYPFHLVALMAGISEVAAADRTESPRRIMSSGQAERMNARFLRCHLPNSWASSDIPSR